MKMVNIAEVKNNLSKLLTMVQQGVEVTICKRNIPIARLVPIAGTRRKNKTKLGCGSGSVQIHGDLTEPLIPVESWEMLRDEDPP